MIFRLYHETRGGHVHCRLFAGQREGALGKCGDLCMRVDEFMIFMATTAGRPIEFRDEPKTRADWLNLESHVGNGNNQTEYTGR